jgi:hypothetical protein
MNRRIPVLWMHVITMVSVKRARTATTAHPIVSRVLRPVVETACANLHSGKTVYPAHRIAGENRMVLQEIVSAAAMEMGAIL